MSNLSEKSFPFDAEEVGGEYDRVYYAEDWMRYFAAFITSGTFLREPTNLQVLANGDMTVTLKTGSMIIDGARYDNIGDIIITLDPADGVLSRIDRIAITWSKPDRDIHYEIRKGEYSYNPMPAECRRNAEYKDYITADVYVAAGAIKINQADITDQRLNSAVCGLAIPFAEINTEEIFLQLQDFYDQTVAEQKEWQDEQKEKITTWFAEIRELLDKENELHDQHKKDLAELFAQLQEKGNSDLVALTQQFIDFRNTNEAKFLEWFETIKGVFSTDAAGELLLKTQTLNEKIADIEEMLFTGMARAELATSQGDTLIDSMGNTIMVRHPICQCTN